MPNARARGLLGLLPAPGLLLLSILLSRRGGYRIQLPARANSSRSPSALIDTHACEWSDCARDVSRGLVVSVHSDAEAASFLSRIGCIICSVKPRAKILERFQSIKGGDEAEVALYVSLYRQRRRR